MKYFLILIIFLLIAAIIYFNLERIKKRKNLYKRIDHEDNIQIEIRNGKRFIANTNKGARIIRD